MTAINKNWVQQGLQMWHMLGCLYLIFDTNQERMGPQDSFCNFSKRLDTDKTFYQVHHH